MYHTVCLSFSTRNLPFPPFESVTRLYIHRIGRSGRFGRKGVAINFARPPRGCGKSGNHEKTQQKTNPFWSSILKLYY